MLGSHSSTTSSPSTPPPSATASLELNRKLAADKTVVRSKNIGQRGTSRRCKGLGAQIDPDLGKNKKLLNAHFALPIHGV